MTVKEAVVPDENNKLVSKGTKSAASERVLSCPQYIVDAFKRIDRRGDHIINQHPETIRRKLQTICNNAGIPFIGLHALRHQNGSTMLLLNVPDRYVMERGGWSNIQTPKTIYQHTMTEGRDQATQAIDRYFNALVSRQNYKLTPGGIPRRKTPKKFRIKR